LYGGAVQVESGVGKGSCFIVMLPVTEIKRYEIVRDVEPGGATAPEGDAEVFDQKTLDLSRKPVLLLVEDNEDFRAYLRNSLGSSYTILEAANGKQGFEKAVVALPDLVVTDVMMPEMNGID